MADLSRRVETLPLVDHDRGHWTEPGAPRPVRTTLWRPARSDPAPLVLLSHGTGGAARDLDWLADGLCDAGYAVAAVDHHGNTSTEPYVAEGFVFWWERPRDLTVVLDALADDPGIDLARVGAAGYSLGGYTVAALVGARIAPQGLRALIANPDLAPLPEYPNLVTELIDRHGPATSYAILMSACPVDVSDSRVRCAFQLAPSMGPLCDPGSLARIAVPVRTIWGDADTQVPGVRAYREHIPGATGRGLPQTAHYDFLTRPETQREAVREALDFFGRTLPPH